jgi:hypothetical protein
MAGNIPLSEWSGSGATDRLRKVVEKNAKTTSRQNVALLLMTGAILLLTGYLVWLEVFSR